VAYGLVTTTAPEPTVDPPDVLTTELPGVVGTGKTGTPPNVGTVVVVVPVVVVVVVGVLVGTLAPPARPLETTVPTVSVPTNPPCIALFAASRLLGASV
jgi:hypothetical protein